MKCKMCGNELNEDGEFCGKCGMPQLRSEGKAPWSDMLKNNPGTKDWLNNHAEKVDRLKIAQYIALAATLLSIIGSILGAWSGSTVGSCFLSAGFITALVSYIFGGFGTAVSAALNIAKWGWLIVPFPYDIPVFIMTALIAIIVFCLLPIIPVRVAYTRSRI